MNHLTAFLTLALLTASAAWAMSSTQQGQGVPVGTGPGFADYWWLIIIVIVVAAAIWYYTRRNRTSV
jgi:sterol desaturase/sphingolipid hydroxylase (fatty acid hydroxylase superfamily)